MANNNYAECNNYTEHNKNSVYEYGSLDDIDEAVDFLKNPASFRTFDKGLATLLRRKGYSGDFNNIAEMSEYLTAKLRRIGSSIEKATVASWFSGKHSPKIEAGSRQKIYEICFSMDLTYQDTLWFFQHVYYDRAFNCHTIEEAVFCYAFQKHISYPEARKIIQEIRDASAIISENTPAMIPNDSPSVIPEDASVVIPKGASSVISEDASVMISDGTSIIVSKNVPVMVSEDRDGMGKNYTRFIQNKISEFHSTDELKEFLIANKDNFNTWNKTALKTLQNLISILTTPPEETFRIDKLKRNLSRQITSNSNGHATKISLTHTPIYEHCGLLMKEILFDAENSDDAMGKSPAEFVMDFIQNRNPNSNDFLLEHILTTSSGMQKKVEVPYVVRNNFPSKKVLSDVLSEAKITTSKSYDSIRKMIILLDFYCFWVRVKLGIGCGRFTKEELTEIYIEEANARLYECGYEELYAGNPYEWIFLCAAQDDEPLEYLRSCVAELGDC